MGTGRRKREGGRVIHGENVKHFPLLCHKQNAVVVTCRITFFFLCFLRLALDEERIQRGTGERGGPPGDGEGRGQDPVGRSGSEHLRDAPGDRSGESFFCRAMSRQLARHQFLLFFLSLYTRTTPRRHTSFLLSTTRTEFWLFPIRYTQRV